MEFSLRSSGMDKENTEGPKREAASSLASPLRGPAGNVEFLAALVANASSIAMNDAIERALTQAPGE